MRRLLYILLGFPLIFFACGKKSGMVLDQEDMASLMADMHIAEAVVDMNSASFPTDSSRQALKQSIYAAHGVTSEQVDSSYIWYGYHIEEYMKVYDRTIEIIKDRQRQMLTASSEQVVVAGDSVDIWPLAPRMEISRRSPSRILTFSIPVDSNWRHHDVFTLRYHMASTKMPVIARMNVEYADGTTYFNLQSGRSQGTGEVNVRIDSMLQPQRIVGYIMAAPQENETVLLDSISLVRTREYIPTRYFSMRQFNYGKSTHNSLRNSRDAASKRTDQPSSATNQTAGASHLSPTKSQSNAANNPRSNGLHNNHNNSPQSTQQAPSATGGSAAQEAVRERNALLRKASQSNKK